MKNLNYLFLATLISFCSINSVADNNLQENFLSKSDMWFLNNTGFNFKINTDESNLNWLTFKSRPGVDVQLPTEPVVLKKKIKIAVLEEEFDFNNTYLKKFVNSDILKQQQADFNAIISDITNSIPNDEKDDSIAARDFMNKFKNDYTSASDHGTHVTGIIISILSKLKSQQGNAEDYFEIIPIRLRPMRNAIIYTLVTNGSPVIKNIIFKLYGMEIVGKILNEKIYDLYMSSIAEAMNLKADVINVSAGFPDINDPTTTEKNFIQFEKNQLLIVSASGNRSSRDVQLPCKDTRSVCVGSILPNGDYAYSFTNSTSGGSNYGAGVDVLAPGYQILSSANQSGYDYLNLFDTTMKILNGTSQSAPMVTAQVAILKSIYPNETNSEIRGRIFSSAINTQVNEYNQIGDLSPSLFGTISIRHSISQPPQNSMMRPQIKDLTNEINLLTEKNTQTTHIPWKLKWTCESKQCQPTSFSIRIWQNENLILSEKKIVRFKENNLSETLHTLALDAAKSSKLKLEIILLNNPTTKKIIAEVILLQNSRTDSVLDLAYDPQKQLPTNQRTNYSTLNNHPEIALFYAGDSINLFNLETKTLIASKKIPNLMNILITKTFKNKLGEYIALVGQVAQSKLGNEKTMAIWYLDFNLNFLNGFKNEMALDLLNGVRPSKTNDFKWISQTINSQEVLVPFIHSVMPINHTELTLNPVPRSYRLSVNNSQKLRKQIYTFVAQNDILTMNMITNLSLYTELYKKLNLGINDEIDFVASITPDAFQYHYLVHIQKKNGESQDITLIINADLSWTVKASPFKSQLSQNPNNYQSITDLSSLSPNNKATVIVKPVTTFEQSIYFRDSIENQVFSIASNTAIQSIYAVYRENKSSVFIVLVTKNGFELWKATSQSEKAIKVSEIKYEFPFLLKPAEYAASFDFIEISQSHHIILSNNTLWGGHGFMPIEIIGEKFIQKLQNSYSLPTNCINKSARYYENQLSVVLSCRNQFKQFVLPLE